MNLENSQQFLPKVVQFYHVLRGSESGTCLQLKFVQWTEALMKIHGEEDNCIIGSVLCMQVNNNAFQFKLTKVVRRHQILNRLPKQEG